MKRLSVILFSITIVSLLFMDAGFSFAEKVRGVTDDTITIGVIADQTGLAASVLVPYTNAVRTLFRNINDQGGINGRKVKIIVEDDRYSIPGAIASFKKLIFRDNVLTILCSGGTGQTYALSSQIEKNKVPVIPLSLADGLADPVRRYIFLASASYDDGLKLCADYIMKDLKAKNPKIAMVYPDVEFGKNGYKATKEYLKNYNLEFYTTSIINLTEIDATSQVLTLKKSDPDYIIFQNGVAGLISFYKAAKQYNLRAKVLGGFYISDEDNIKSTGDAMKDTVAVSPIGYWSDNTPGMVEIRKITTKYNPQTKPMTRNFTQGWVTSMICAEGMKRAGKNLNHETLVEAYETFNNFSTGEISAPVSYSKTNHKAGTMNKLYKVDVKNQTFIPITGFREPAFKD